MKQIHRNATLGNYQKPTAAEIGRIKSRMRFSAKKHEDSSAATAPFSLLTGSLQMLW